MTDPGTASPVHPISHKLTHDNNPDTADSSDHVGAAKAITAGLVAGHSSDRPGYWLHTGGTGILTFEDSDAGQYGRPSDKVYDDWGAVDELLTLPDHAFHRDVDRLVLEAGAKYADVLRTALVCPPTIYGTVSYFLLPDPFPSLSGPGCFCGEC